MIHSGFDNFLQINILHLILLICISFSDRVSYKLRTVSYCENERHRYSVFLKPNWKHLKLQLNQCSSTGFVKIFSNPVPQTFSMIFKILSKTALKLLVILS